MPNVAERIDGKAVADEVRAEVRSEVLEFRRRFGIAPGLATVLVGDDPASATYVRNKRKACAECGIDSLHHELGASTSQDELLALVKQLNARRDAHGILVQLPLPAGLDSQAILEAIDPAKDVDGLHPLNQARLMAGTEGLRPCTPLGVMRLLDQRQVELKGRARRRRRTQSARRQAGCAASTRAPRDGDASATRARAISPRRSAAPTSWSPRSARRASSAATWIRPGAMVIDVGINRGADGTSGRRRRVRERAASAPRYITPVPGGVGPMTIAMLLENTLTRRHPPGSRRASVARHEAHAALRLAPGPGRAHGRVRRLGDAGAVQRHHRRAPCRARARRSLRRQPHGRDRGARPGRARRLPASHRATTWRGSHDGQAQYTLLLPAERRRRRRRHPVSPRRRPLPLLRQRRRTPTAISNWMQEQAARRRACIDRSDDFALLALQGPRRPRILTRADGRRRWPACARFRFARARSPARRPSSRAPATPARTAGSSTARRKPRATPVGSDPRRRGGPTVSFRPGSARATRCGSKRPCRSTATS